MFSDRTEYLTNRGGRLPSESMVAGVPADRAVEKSPSAHQRNLFAQIIASNGGTAVGVELALPNTSYYCAILEEPDSSGRGRIVYFNSEGLSPHRTYGSPGEALEVALGQGYVERADGTMDGLATSEAWRQRFAYSALVGRYARGEIDAHQFAVEVRKLG